MLQQSKLRTRREPQRESHHTGSFFACWDRLSNSSLDVTSSKCFTRAVLGASAGEGGEGDPVGLHFSNHDTQWTRMECRELWAV